MIATWMVSAVLVGLLVTAGATAADRLLSAIRRPSRFVWLGAMVLTSMWPVLAYVRARNAQSVSSAAPIADGVQRLTAIVVGASERTLHVPFDTVLLTAWALLSAALFARLVFALYALKHRGRLWRADSIDGVEVKLSRDVGPAVVGLGSMEVVLPEWALDLDQPLRSLVLRHEDEHRRARDPYLLFASVLLGVLTPWNVALHWQSRRLRLAIELDCDARVLHADPRPERYSLLLLAIAQRRSANHSLLAPALSEPTSNLERRITAMRNPFTTPSRTRLAVLGGIAIATIVVACAIDAPTSPTALKPVAAARNLAADTGYAIMTNTTPSGPITAKVRYTGDSIIYKDRDAHKLEVRPKQPIIEERTAEVKSARQIPGTYPHYPDDLKAAGSEGSVVVSFVVDTLGHADTATFRVLQLTVHSGSQTDALKYRDAVRAWLPDARFEPAEIEGRKVRQVVELPFEFRINQ